MAEVAAMISDRVLYGRLRTALIDHHPVRTVRTADDLRTVLQERPIALVVVETGSPTLDDAASTVRMVRTQYPRVPVVAYCHVRRELARDVLDLVHAGVHDLLFVDVDDDRARLTGLVSRAAQRSVTADVVEHAAAVGLSASGRVLLHTFLDAAVRPFSVQQIAGMLGIHRRTLFQRLEAARLPTPQSLGAWCRLLVAARLLDDPARTIERVAHDLGFASGNALRNLLQRHAKLSPTALRVQGGYPFLRDRFVAGLVGPAVTCNTDDPDDGCTPPLRREEVRPPSHGTTRRASP